MDDKYAQEVEWRYKEIRCPVSILWGEDDEWIPLKDGGELARRIPGASFHTASKAKHLLQEDAPEAIMSTVLGFWQALNKR
jgi:pimeloyl-ACP methyl ester carboxylesterase